ncbi:MAG TPA: type II secretion system secretin GspD [Gammaproteobacteria bacterium]|nr:type II secretion system secretin GspD [Gammaproteobacteria bacterium]
MSHHHINDLLRQTLRVPLVLVALLYVDVMQAQEEYVPPEEFQEQPQIDSSDSGGGSQSAGGMPSTPVVQQPLEQTPLGPESATLNLNNADIRILINTVSKATGQNFIVDPRVKGKVTVVSAKPMTKSEIYEVFLAVLQVHGFAAVPADGIVKIVPDATAKQSSVPMGKPGESNSDQLVTRVLQLEHVAAGQLVPIIRPLVPQQGHLAAYAPTNVLVITDRASNISRMVDIIRRIDRPDNDEIEIIKLENASASEMVRIIQGVMQKQQQEGGSVPGNPLLTADERTNSILLTGDKASRLRIRTIIAQLDTPLESGGNTKVVFLKYAAAANLVAILQGVIEKSLGDQQQQPAPGQPRISIQADETTNSLVITAPSSAVRQLETIIRQLDIPRAQVLIEAIIAEVSTNLAEELGSQFLVDGSGDGSGPVGGSLFSESFNLNNFIARGATGGVSSNTPTIGDGLTIALGDRSASTQFAFILRALKGDAATNILSTPTLLTLDNVEAEIVFGQNVPFVTGSFANTGGAGVTNPFQTIERQDVGITLKVKPQINEGNAIKLQIQQEVSNLESSAVASDVVTNKRAIRTEVMIEDGQTIVLGGLIKDEFFDTVRKVPLLGSIPILGRLFSFTKTEKKKSNLMVFIRPVIMEAGGSADYFTSQKYSLIRARQLEAKIGDRGLIKDSAAELPNIEVLFAPIPPNLKAKNTRQMELPENEPAVMHKPQAAAGTAPAQSVIATGQLTATQPQAPVAPVTATGQPAVAQPQASVEPVTATGQPATAPQSQTPVEPVTATGQPAESLVEQETQPPAEGAAQRQPDTTELPDIELE